MSRKGVNMNQLLIIWLGVLIAAVVVELLSMGLTSIWFAGGALIAAVVAAIGGPLWLQVVLFVLVSIALLAITRPIAVRYFNKQRVLTNVESMVGKRGFVISEIDNLRGIGQVNVGGQEWTARSEDETRVIPEGTIVHVVAVNGVKLIVEIDESVAEHVPVIRSEAQLDPRYIEETTE